MEIAGKPTINPVLFFTGKICGYATWVILVLELFNVQAVTVRSFLFSWKLSFVSLGAGVFFLVASSINLGRSTRIGLPKEQTELKISGVYRISRNPMYVGFNLVTISSVLYTLNPYVLIMAIYSIVIYHYIILGEEKFLENRFGDEYLNYCKKTRRYF